MLKLTYQKLIDTEGLQLSYEGWDGNEYGGDSYAEIIFPFEEDEYVAAMEIIDIFISEFKAG